MEGIGQKKETDYIFDKTIKCDVCGKEFKTKQVRTGKARFIGTDDILKPLYEGIDTCKYDIMMCPHCGYAASLRLFGHHTEKQRQAVRDNVSSRFTAKEPETETYSYERAVKRCKMAMLTEMVTGGKISESAYLCLKLAWIYRGEIHSMMCLRLFMRWDMRCTLIIPMRTSLISMPDIRSLLRRLRQPVMRHFLCSIC